MASMPALPEDSGTPGQSAMGSPARAGRVLPTSSIGDVLKQLQVDFPDVSVSKIRFLESEGLITPQRSKSGYRRFSPGGGGWGGRSGEGTSGTSLRLVGGAVDGRSRA